MPEAALRGCGIAITRPADQARKLSALIEAAGGKPILYPLIAIAPLPDYHAFEQQLARLADCDWAIFISSNAVEHAMPRLLSTLGTIPQKPRFAAIGPQTAAALAGYGVTQTLIPSGRFDSEALLALPEMQQVAGQRIMIFRGIGGRELLADSLTARGAVVDFAESYRRINPQTDASLLNTLWQNKQLQAIVVTSSEAMRHLLALAGNGAAAWLRQTLLCVNHARVGESPQQLGLRVAVAAASGDEAMLQCLIDHLNQNR